MNACAATSRLVSPAAASSATRTLRARQLLRGAAQPDALELGTRLLGPVRRSEPLEDLERPLEIVRRGAALPRPAVQAPPREQRQAEIEGELRCLRLVEFVERGQRARDVAVGSQHERTRARQRDVDPQARETAPALLQTLEHTPRAFEVAERDERLDAERLAPVREAFARADLGDDLVHADERILDLPVPPGRELDEREAGQQQRLPPAGDARTRCLLNQRFQRLARPLDPPAARIHDRPETEDHCPRPRPLDLRDRRAALLEQRLRELPLSRPELRVSPVRPPLGPPVVLAAHAVPLVLDRVARPRGLEVVDGVEVDEREHALRRLGACTLLELPPSLQQLGLWIVAEHQACPHPRDDDRGQRAGSPLGIQRLASPPPRARPPAPGRARR